MFLFERLVIKTGKILFFSFKSYLNCLGEPWLLKAVVVEDATKMTSGVLLLLEIFFFFEFI